jgi:hypothetical protein
VSFKHSESKKAADQSRLLQRNAVQEGCRTARGFVRVKDSMAVMEVGDGEDGDRNHDWLHDRPI